MSGFLVLISPAKSLREYPLLDNGLLYTQARCLEKSSLLINSLSKKTKKDISKLMSLSDNLSVLNIERYKNWNLEHNLKNSLPAAYTFDGDVYKTLQFESLNQAEIEFAQKHLRILSGLYGLLRPLDLIQPHRLEMGTSLKIRSTQNLYGFWNKEVFALLKEDLANNNCSAIINLASQEYFEAAKSISEYTKVINVDFKEFKNGTFQTIGIFAKQARGLMARFIIQKKIISEKELLRFNANSYSYNPELSKEDKLVFTRNI